MRIREWLRAMGRMLRGRYVCLLEEEMARLRAENLALLNSLLGTAGVPPLRMEVKEGSAGLKPGATQTRAGIAGGGDGGGNGAVRKRSWQQIGRMLEIEEARREREHAARVAEIRERWTAEGNGEERGDSGKR
jgi:hypothetical protein